MEFVRKIVETDSLAKWNHLHFIGDVHLGATGHNAKIFNEKLKEIEDDPLALWFGMGDYGDHIYFNDPRFSPNEQDEGLTMVELRSGIMKQIRSLSEKFEPIKDKCVGLGTGNHEETIAKRYHVDPTRELCYLLGSAYLGYSSLNTITFRHSQSNGKKGRSATLRVYTNHGHGGGRRNGSQLNKIEDAIRIAEADIYAMGHVHGKTGSQLEIIGSCNRGKERKKVKTFVVTGCYQDVSRPSKMTYAERNMYAQSPLGSPMVGVRWTGSSNKDMRTRIAL